MAHTNRSGDVAKQPKIFLSPIRSLVRLTITRLLRWWTERHYKLKTSYIVQQRHFYSHFLFFFFYFTLFRYPHHISFFLQWARLLTILTIYFFFFSFLSISLSSSFFLSALRSVQIYNFISHSLFVFTSLSPWTERRQTFSYVCKLKITLISFFPYRVICFKSHKYCSIINQPVAWEGALDNMFAFSTFCHVYFSFAGQQALTIACARKKMKKTNARTVRWTGDKYKWLFKSNESTNRQEIQMNKIKVTFENIDPMSYTVPPQLKFSNATFHFSFEFNAISSCLRDSWFFRKSS